jgi:hypothetical protein
MAEITNPFRMTLSEKVYTRDAAYMVAINKEVNAMQLCGWI